MGLCWPIFMPPTQKAVLISLADQSNDHGSCWPSISGICARTCFGRTAVIEAIKWLEDNGFLSIEKSGGRNNRYLLSLTKLRQRELEPVRLANQSGKRTSPASERVPVRQADQPVRQADPNRQEPSLEPSKKKAPRQVAPTVARPEDVSEQTWDDWCQLRNKKRAPVTATVVAEARRESLKADMTLERFLTVWCSRGSQGLQASWLVDKRAPSAASKHTGFDTKNYREGVTEDGSLA